MIDWLQNNRTTKRERRSSIFGCKRPPQELLTSSVHKPGCLGQTVELRPLQVASFRGVVALQNLFQLLETEPDIPYGKDDWRI